MSTPQYDLDASSASAESFSQQPKENSHKPGSSAFRQQRLKAYNPVFTARTVIPLLVGIAVVFAPLGAAMWLALHRVQDLAIDYSQCEKLALSEGWREIPETFVELNFHNNAQPKNRPQWKLDTDELQAFADERKVCRIQFEVPLRWTAPVYFFYRLEGFYANHRRYVKSFSEDQIEGKAASVNVIKNTVGQNCEPLSLDANGKRIYPCGLIANSLFNDTYTLTLSAVNGTSSDYEMTAKGIAWKSDRDRFKKTKYHHEDIVPPPNWYKRFPDGYNATNVPDISEWEEFQNWMHPAGLPTFNKLAQRNDDQALEPGIYEVAVGLHFPVLPYNGHKFIYLSQRSVIGGKNYFLGYSWMVGGGLCFVLALLLLVINFVKPRRTGDVSLLSWNKEQFKRDEQEEKAS